MSNLIYISPNPHSIRNLIPPNQIPILVAILDDKRCRVIISFHLLKQIFFCFHLLNWDSGNNDPWLFWEQGSNKRSFSICYFIFLFAHESQYFSIMVAPSTVNIASWVAVLPQLTQYFVFPPTSTNALIDEKFFSIICRQLLLLCNCTYSICLLYVSQI